MGLRRFCQTPPDIYAPKYLARRAFENQETSDEHIRLLLPAMLRSLINYDNPRSLGSSFRRRRFRHVETLIDQILREKPRCSILDVGGTARYWRALDTRYFERVSLTILNLEAPRGLDVQTGGPPSLAVRCEVGDGRDLSRFGNKSFDLVHSNSVLEHVGLYSDMVKFAKEIQRVGLAHFVQTPNLWFPIDPHYGVPFIHWLPWPLRAKLLTSFNIGFKSKFPSFTEAADYAEYINLLNTTALRQLFPTSNLIKERVLLLTKSLMVIGAPREFYTLQSNQASAPCG